MEKERKITNINMKDLKELLKNNPKKIVTLECDVQVGWGCRIQAPVSSVLDQDEYLYISNSFAGTDDDAYFHYKLTDELYEEIRNLSDDLKIALEIYSFDLKENMNNQMIIEESPNVYIPNEDGVLRIIFSTKRAIFEPVRIKKSL